MAQVNQAAVLSVMRRLMDSAKHTVSNDLATMVLRRRQSKYSAGALPCQISVYLVCQLLLYLSK